MSFGGLHGEMMTALFSTLHQRQQQQKVKQMLVIMITIDGSFSSFSADAHTIFPQHHINIPANYVMQKTCSLCLFASKLLLKTGQS